MAMALIKRGPRHRITRSAFNCAGVKLPPLRAVAPVLPLMLEIGDQRALADAFDNTSKERLA
jgi:hypothetical protein